MEKLKKFFIVFGVVLIIFVGFVFLFSSHGIMPSIISYFEKRKAESTLLVEEKKIELSKNIQKCLDFARTDEERKFCQVDQGEKTSFTWSRYQDQVIAIESPFEIKKNPEASRELLSMYKQSLGDKVVALTDYSVLTPQFQAPFSAGMIAVTFSSPQIINLNNALLGGYKGFLNRAGVKQDPPPIIPVSIEGVHEAKRISGLVTLSDGIASFSIFGARFGAVMFTIQVYDPHQKFTEDDFYRLIHSVRQGH